MNKKSRFSSSREDGRPVHQGFHEKRSEFEYEVNSRMNDEGNFLKPRTHSNSRVREDYHSLNDPHYV